MLTLKGDAPAPSAVLQLLNGDDLIGCVTFGSRWGDDLRAEAYDLDLAGIEWSRIEGGVGLIDAQLAYEEARQRYGDAVLASQARIEIGRKEFRVTSQAALDKRLATLLDSPEWYALEQQERIAKASAGLTYEERREIEADCCKESCGDRAMPCHEGPYVTGCYEALLAAIERRESDRS